jgi:hypothetical protein
MKKYEGVDVQIHVFLTSALVGGAATCPCRFSPGERSSGIRWKGSWVDPRVGLDYLEKWKFFTLPGLEFRSLDRPACSQLL